MLVLAAPFPEPSRTSAGLTVAPPQPRLQTDPSEDLAQFRAEEDKRLNTYYWIDKKKGLVHIPIEQAMQEMAEKGIDGFPRGQPMKRHRPPSLGVSVHWLSRPRIGASAGEDLSDSLFEPQIQARICRSASISPMNSGQSWRCSRASSSTGKPVVLVLDYLRCTTLVRRLTLENLVAALDGLPVPAGRDFMVVAISIDPRDTPADAAAAKAEYFAIESPTPVSRAGIS